MYFVRVRQYDCSARRFFFRENFWAIQKKKTTSAFPLCPVRFLFSTGFKLFKPQRTHLFLNAGGAVSPATNVHYFLIIKTVTRTIAAVLIYLQQKKFIKRQPVRLLSINCIIIHHQKNFRIRKFHPTFV